MDSKANVDAYLADQRETSRFTSWDYCFNYFQAFRDSEDTNRLASDECREASCLQLGFFLASWGKMRGSAVLHKRSLAYLLPVIDKIAAAPDEVWDADADVYLDSGAEVLVAFGQDLRTAFADGASHTLLTKVVLGVFGNVPAFDRNFNRGFRRSWLNRASLERIGELYGENRKVIDECRMSTIAFGSGAATGRLYTRAKVIDMACWWEGR